MSKLISWLVVIGALLFVVLVGVLITAIPSILLAWIVLKIFPDLTLNLWQLTTIFVVIGTLFRTKVTINKD